MNWMMLGEKSLPFVAAEHGFDVWLGNLRGNTFSNQHIKYTTYDSEYWDFDVEDHALYDVAAQIAYVKQYSGQKVSYIGHSLGTITALWLSAVEMDFVRHHVASFSLYGPAGLFNITEGVEFYPTDGPLTEQKIE